jgi:CBS domain-containing protein
MKTDTIKDIMTKNVVSVSTDQTLLDVKHIYEKKHFHHHIPVTEGEKLVGMISLADFMYGVNGAGLDDNSSIYTEKTVKDIMMPNPKYVPSDAKISEIAQMLSKGRYRALPVVENAKMVGIITTADMIRYYLNKKD